MAPMRTRSAPRPRVYLAGPDVFFPEARAVLARKRALCRRHGFAAVSPLDADPAVKGATRGSRRARGLAIAAANEAKIRGCQLVVANLSPFRGPSADPGTVYELGFARGLGLPVFGYTTDGRPFRERTLAALGLGVRERRRTRDADGLAIEDFGLRDNLMLDGALADGGGVLVAPLRGARLARTDLAGFEACLRAAALLLRARR
jgi:nucleoside 2-deoxyribosyltransferase